MLPTYSTSNTEKKELANSSNGNCYLKKYDMNILDVHQCWLLLFYRHGEQLKYLLGNQKDKKILYTIPLKWQELKWDLKKKNPILFSASFLTEQKPASLLQNTQQHSHTRVSGGWACQESHIETICSWMFSYRFHIFTQKKLNSISML